MIRGGLSELMMLATAVQEAPPRGSIPDDIRAILLFVVLAGGLVVFLTIVVLLMIHRWRVRRDGQKPPRPTPRLPDAWAESARRFKP